MKIIMTFVSYYHLIMWKNQISQENNHSHRKKERAYYHGKGYGECGVVGTL